MDNATSETEARILASFAAQGLMHTFGAEIVHVGRGEVHIAMPSSPALSQQHGHVHAGALTSLVDTACGYAAMTVAAPGCDVLTVEFKVNFMRPARAERFLAIGRVVKSGRTLTVCAGEVTTDDGTTREAVALMQATIISIPGTT